jgi:hypothetical protein
MDSVIALAERFEVPPFRYRWAVTTNLTLFWLRFVAFYAVLANIPYWAASRAFGFVPLGWFCVEYALVGLIALVVPRFVSGILLLVTIFVDLLCGVCQSYYLPVRECLANLGSAHNFSAPRLLGTVAVVLLALLVAANTFLLPGKTLPRVHRLRAAAALTTICILVFFTDVLSVYFSTGHLPGALVKLRGLDSINLSLSKLPRFARFPVLRLAQNVENDASIRAMEKSGEASAFAVPSATALAVRSAGILPGGINRESPNLVLVLVESWGLPQDSALKQALVEPYAQTDLLTKYDVIQGTVPFYGPTIGAEARELCGSGFSFHVLIATTSELKGCLPARLAAIGYETVAMHGMTGRMFDRANWYRTIGFKERWFNEQLKPAGLHDCMGAFVGTCDADIAALIGQRLRDQTPQPYFIHWMTLSSHLPVLVPSPLANGSPCLAALLLAPKSALCSWYQLVTNVHQSVAQVALGNLARPTVFVIVGDHAPPFGDPSLRSRFSQSDVPYVVLLPRSYESHANSLLARSAADVAPGTAKSSRQTP